MAHKQPCEEVVWTESLSDRRLVERRSGWDRRDGIGQAVNIPNLRHQEERRAAERRRRETLLITGRAMHAGFEHEDRD